jgi:predicted amidohydrolase
MAFRVRLAQISPVLGDVAANLERHLTILEEAASDGVDLVAFPEMSLCGYHVRDLAAEVALVRSSPLQAGDFSRGSKKLMETFAEARRKTV